jgi:hypothetical protein
LLFYFILFYFFYYYFLFFFNFFLIFFLIWDLSEMFAFRRLAFSLIPLRSFTPTASLLHTSLPTAKNRQVNERILRFDSSEAFAKLSEIKGRKNILLDCLHLVQEYDQNLAQQMKEYERGIVYPDTEESEDWRSTEGRVPLDVDEEEDYVHNPNAVDEDEDEEYGYDDEEYDDEEYDDEEYDDEEYDEDDEDDEDGEDGEDEDEEDEYEDAEYKETTDRKALPSGKK